MAVTMKFINEHIQTKKKKIHVNLLEAFGKKSKNDYTKTCIYRIFNEILIDKSKNQIFTQNILKDLIVNKNNLSPLSSMIITFH